MSDFSSSSAVFPPPIELRGDLVDETSVRFDPDTGFVFTKYTLVDGRTVEIPMHRAHARQYSTDLALCIVQSFRDMAR